MTRRTITSVGPLSLADFHARCLIMVRETAEGIRRNVTGNVGVQTKVSYAGVVDGDVVTTLDLAAQRHLVARSGQLIPRAVGHIGEERGLRRRPVLLGGVRIILTFDPLDGTKKLVEALRARRSLVPGEVSVMIGVQVDGEAVASYICDVASLVVYARQMYSSQVVRIGPDDLAVDMSYLPRVRSLGRGTLLHHGTREPANPLTLELLDHAFGRVERGKDSIGLSVARIFTGEFAGMLRVAGMHVTPWDDTPVQAMCQQGDVLMLRIGADRLEQISFPDLGRITAQDFDVLYLHCHYLDELRRRVTVVTNG